MWLQILNDKIKNFINKHPNKIIIFTGVLDNFSPDGTIFELDANY